MTRLTPPRPDEQAVFLNVPFDPSYQPVFIGVFSALLALGRKPRCVLELPDLGQGRPARICAVIEKCRVSIHDLSRQGHPPRFNMPFELGLAFAIGRYASRHTTYILEHRAHSVVRCLSDVRMSESHSHGNSARRAVSCVLDILGRSGRDPTPASVEPLRRQLSKVAAELAAQYRRNSVFSAAPYRQFKAAAIQLATARGLISA